MIRLTLLLIAGLVAVLWLFGEPGARVAPEPAQQETAEAEPEPEAEAEPEAPVETEPAAATAETVEQTPAQVQHFPGPDLRPSPEFANDEETAVAEVQADGGTIVYITGNRVNYRAGPSTTAAVIGTLTGGDPVEALGPPEGDWINIRDVQGRSGYVSSQFVSNTPPG